MELARQDKKDEGREQGGGGNSGFGQMEKMKEMRGEEAWRSGVMAGMLPSNLMVLGVASCSLSFCTLTRERKRSTLDEKS